MFKLCSLGGMVRRSESSESMSSGLMSCVRENSPPMEDDCFSVSGPLSLPVVSTTNFLRNPNNCNFNDSLEASSAKPLSPEVDVSHLESTEAVTQAEKRRRFQPFRGLRRIFRRRTISSPSNNKNEIGAATSATEQIIQYRSEQFQKEQNTSGKDFNKSTKSDKTSTTATPNSQQIESAYSSQSLPKPVTINGENSAKPSITRLFGINYARAPVTPESFEHCQTCTSPPNTMYGTNILEEGVQYPNRYMLFQNHHHHNNAIRKSMGLSALQITSAVQNAKEKAIDPKKSDDVFRRNLSQESEDSNSDLKTSEHPTSGSSGIVSMANSYDVRDNQQSFSESPLNDSRCCDEPLSQSHDSVYSESAANGNSYSSALHKAELADALRKRNRNRPDVSEEDLGLPRSPASTRHFSDDKASEQPKSHTHSSANVKLLNDNNRSSLSLETSHDAHSNEFLATSTANNSHNDDSSLQKDRSPAAQNTASRYSHRSSIKTLGLNTASQNTLASRTTFQDFPDHLDAPRLSHDGAKHKMALRPKKKMPSRMYRRTISNSIPEASENIIRIHPTTAFYEDARVKALSLQPDAILKDGVKNEKDIQMENCKLNNSTGVKVSHFTRKRNANSPLETPKIKTIQIPAYNHRSHSTKSGLQDDEIHLREIANDKVVIDDYRSIGTSDIKTNAFLRRITLRNSKMENSKFNRDEFDLPITTATTTSGPKEMHKSHSNYEATEYSEHIKPRKRSSEMTYDEFITDTRRDIVREIKHEGKNGMDALLNNYMAITSPTKPIDIKKMGNNNNNSARNSISPNSGTPTKAKSGPEARQRYAPISINLPDNKDMHSMPTTSCQNKVSDLKGQEYEWEAFSSTSLVRNMREADQLHYERKPKIVGLSAFQQKVSRTSNSINDNANKRNNSRNSLDFDEIYDNHNADNIAECEKNRKSVEKSRSFRHYAKTTDAERTICSTNANMPSLPDLTVKERSSPIHYFQISSPNQDKSVSLGFEINDNNLMRPNDKSLAKSATHLVSRQIAQNTVILPKVSPSNSSNRDISEIEDNIDMIVKSPYVNLLQRPTTSSTSKSSEDLAYRTQPSKNRPNRLSLKLDQSYEEFNDKLSPKMAVKVALRGKNQESPTTFNSKLAYEAKQRSSAPIATLLHETAIQARRSVSLNNNNPSPIKNRVEVPEFMKIQLNPVDVVHKMNESAISAKNLRNQSPILMKTSMDSSKESSPSPSYSSTGTATTTIRSHSRDGSVSPIMKSTPMRHDSNESIEIKENRTPTEQKPTNIIEAINGDARVLVCDFMSRNKFRQNPIPLLNATSSTATNSPKSPAGELKTPESPGQNITGTSLQELRLKFLNEDNKINKRVEDMRTERKKSISDEVHQRKEPPQKVENEPMNNNKKPPVVSKVDENKSSPPIKASNDNIKESAQASKHVTPRMEKQAAGNLSKPPKPIPAKCVPGVEVYEKSTVIFRKKLPTPVMSKVQPSFDNNNNNNREDNVRTSSTSPSSSRKNSAQHDESELMKVFARRSLKVKDDDANALNEKISSGNSAGARKSICVAQLAKMNSNGNINHNSNNNNNNNSTGSQAQQYKVKVQAGVDSDKENQSTSQERLDKLHKNEVSADNQNNGNGSNGLMPKVRASMSVDRNVTNEANKSITFLKFNKNINNNNNNNNNINSRSSTTEKANLPKSPSTIARNFLPPIKANKTNNYNNNDSNNNKNNSNNNNNNNNNNSAVNNKSISTLNFNNNNNNNNNNNSNNTNGLSTSSTDVKSTNSLNNNNNSCSNNNEKINNRKNQQLIYETGKPSALLTIAKQNDSFKVVERSATVGEFKNINQRRAEWEQRAKSGGIS